MKFEEFQSEVEQAGLVAKWCSVHHWQIRDGSKVPVVNVWPNGKKGFRFQWGDGRAKNGTVQDAIRVAGPKYKKYKEEAPWNDASENPEKQKSSERVGLIRWLWRLLW
jgi:hypothetical protein